jgi:hypothetical protein
MSNRSKKNHGLKTQPKEPEAWAKAISQVKDPRIRQHVASVVWWDFFGLRGFDTTTGKNLERWPHLDPYLEQAFDSKLRDPSAAPELATCSELYAALRQVGYTTTDASHRSREKNGDARPKTNRRIGIAHRRKTDEAVRNPTRGAIA